MKTNSIIRFTIGFLVGFFIPQTILAQGTVYVSNLGQPSVGSLPVGSDSWHAAQFSIGAFPPTYLLNSVQLRMNGATGNPSDFTVTVHTNKQSSFASPGGSIGQLVGSTNPATAGIYTYSPTTPFFLNPLGVGSVFFIVVTAGTPVAGDAYAWSAAGSPSYSTVNQWTGGTKSYYSNDGTSWILNSASFPQFAVNASPWVPEPSAGMLFLMGSLFASGRLVRNRCPANSPLRRLS